MQWQPAYLLVFHNAAFTLQKMTFDPACDYGDTDLTINDNLVCWKFEELIKNLITLSSDAKKQAEIVGFGALCDEMTEDFYTYFTLSYPSYLDSNLLTSNQVMKLKVLNAFFDERSGNKSPDFWDDLRLETSSEWQIVRQKSKEVLQSLGMQDLTLKIDRTEKYEMTNTGKQLVIQSTKTRLVRPNDS